VYGWTVTELVIWNLQLATSWYMPLLGRKVLTHEAQWVGP